MSRVHGKVDANQKEIVQGLRMLGASVLSLADIGKGCPDLLVGFRYETYLFEVKAEKGKLTNDERDWISEWRGDTVFVIHSLREAMERIGAI